MKIRHWTKEEINYVRANYMDKSEREIGVFLDRKPSTIGCKARHLGIRKGWGKPRGRTYAINDTIFKTWTPISAYLIGLILTDGNLLGRRFSIASKDFEILEKAKNALSSAHPIKKIAKKNLFILTIGHTGMISDLKFIGITENKSKTCTLPDIPDNFFFDFLRGYIDGDGGIYNRPRKGLTIKLTTGSPYIFDDISHTISRILNMDKAIPKTRHGYKKQTYCTWYELSYYGAYASLICKSIYDHCDYLFLSRKRQNYIDYLNRPIDWRSNGNGTKYHLS